MVLPAELSFGQNDGGTLSLHQFDQDGEKGRKPLHTNVNRTSKSLLADESRAKLVSGPSLNSLMIVSADLKPKVWAILDTLNSNRATSYATGSD